VERLRGRLLIASPLLLDPNFRRTVVLVLAHGREGAVGVVLNRPSELAVAEHLPFGTAFATPPAVLFLGGPVAPEVALGLGWSSAGAVPTASDQGRDPAAGGTDIGEEMGEEGRPAGGREPLVGPIRPVDLAREVSEWRDGQLRVFTGYAGWAPGQLEAEIASGAWFVVNPAVDDVLGPAPAHLWTTVLRRQSGSLRLLASFPDNPLWN
jgi:putative transcriptional regulator